LSLVKVVFAFLQLVTMVVLKNITTFCECQDPIDAHYEMLKTEISVLEETSDDYKVRPHTMLFFKRLILNVVCNCAFFVLDSGGVCAEHSCLHPHTVQPGD
jgi:hypothetical protein